MCRCVAVYGVKVGGKMRFCPGSWSAVNPICKRPGKNLILKPFLAGVRTSPFFFFKIRISVF